MAEGEPVGKGMESKTLREVAVSALDLFVKVFAVGVPVLYVLGRAYKEAYWNSANLSISLMGYSVEDYLYWGFVVVLNKIFAWMHVVPAGPLGGLAIVALVLALISISAVVLRRIFFPAFKARIALAEQRIRSWRANDSSWAVQFLRPFVALGLAVYTLLFYFLFVTFCAAAPILLAYSAGTQAAQQDRKGLIGVGPVSSYDRRSLIHLKNETSLQQVGLLLECSTQWCVMLRRGDFVAVRQEDIASIDHCPALKTLKNGVLICEGKIFPD